MLPELRELRYFVAVAEERRFTRAAERLFITQQSLSAAIAQLERRLGVELFVRDRQGLGLTPGGEALLVAARGILAQAATAVQDTRRAAGAAPLRVGYTVLAASELTTPILTHLQAAEPQLEIRLRLADYDDPSAGLATAPPTSRSCAARSTALRLRGPVRRGPRSGATGPQRWRAAPAWASTSWRRAGHHRPRARRGLARLLHRRRRPRPPAGPGVEVGSFDEELATVALGRAIAFTSAAAARLYPQPDVAYVPLAGAAPCTVALAWDPERPPTVLASLLAAARRAREQAHADGSFELYSWR